MKEIFTLFIKGLIIGIGQIIPGVSGGMLAISLGLYERGIGAISNFFNNIKNNLKFLIPVGLGIVVSVLYTSKVIKYFLFLPTFIFSLTLYSLYKNSGFTLVLFLASFISGSNIYITHF